MVCSPSPEAGVRAMLDAVALGLAPGGCFVLVSYGAPAERTAWLAPEQRGWEARARAHARGMQCLRA
jgi:hypothetical protein